MVDKEVHASAQDDSLCSRRAQLEAELRERYGEVLTLGDLRTILRYPSLPAIRKAHQRNRLPIVLAKMPPRRGWFTTPAAVAKLLASINY